MWAGAMFEPGPGAGAEPTLLLRAGYERGHWGEGARSDGGARGIRGGGPDREAGEAQGGVRGTGTGGTVTVSFRYSEIVTSGVPRPFSVFWCGIPRVNVYTIPSYTLRYSPPPAPPPSTPPQPSTPHTSAPPGSVHPDIRTTPAEPPDRRPTSAHPRWDL